MRWFALVLLILFTLMATQALLNISVWQYDPEANWINAIYTKKEAAAAPASANKIVIIGGSAALFGVEAETVSKNMHMDAFNLATHAGLEIDYLLHRARKNIRSGDIVVLIPEYEHFGYNNRASAIRDKFVLGFDHEYINSLPLPQKLRTIFSPTPAALVKLAVNIFKDSKHNYNAATLNEYGDETSQYGVLNYVPAPIAINNKIEISYLAEFADWCRANNIKLLLAWPPLIDNPAYQNTAYQDFFGSISNQLAALEIDIIGKPQDTLLAPQYFYDTRYHLNNKGSELYTDWLLDSITSDNF